MNETKVKTVSEERDEAIWLMNKTSLELNRTKANLWTANEAIKSMGESLDESRKLAAELNGQIDQLKAQLAATEEALAQVQRESAELRTKYEAGQKVIQGAIKWQMTATYEQAAPFSDLIHIIAEYRILTETPASNQNGFFPGFPPGFDVKRAEKGLAQEGGSREIGRNQAETGQGSILGR